MPDLTQLEHGVLLRSGIMALVVGVFIPENKLSKAAKVFNKVAQSYEPALFYLGEGIELIKYYQLAVNSTMELLLKS